ncbi:MAG: hypothetical protein ACYC0W_07115, partial [Candidatus Nanopelagicales bacterium]
MREERQVGSLSGGVALLPAIVPAVGFYTLRPNEARVLILFGSYKGNVRRPGFMCGNTCYANGSAGQQQAARLPGRKPKGDGEPGRRRAGRGATRCPGGPARSTASGSRSTTAAATGRDRGRRRVARRGNGQGG